MRATVVLFDIDGTLVSCGGAGRRAMELAFLELFGRDDVFDFPFGGGTDRAIARKALENGGRPTSDVDIDRFLDVYLRHLSPTLATSEKYAVLPGVHELLDALEGHVAIGLGTGNVERGARAKLARGGIDGRFSFGGFGCDHEERARLLEAGAVRGAKKLGVARGECRIVVVGDTPRDVQAAHAIDAECIAVATGAAPIEVLRDTGASIVAGDLLAPAVLAAIV
jgi:phosphoglycolate phosphatase